MIRITDIVKKNRLNILENRISLFLIYGIVVPLSTVPAFTIFRNSDILIFSYFRLGSKLIF
jgi:hypothetical protein